MRDKLAFFGKHPLTVRGMRLFYIVCMVYILVFWRAFWTPDLLFIMFFFLFLLYGQGRQFFVNFGPFVAALLAYDSLRGVVPFLSKHVHFTEMIDFDKWLFGGHLPTVVLQQWWYSGHAVWYDFFFYLLYMCHFVAPMIAAVLIWKYRPQHYLRYGLAFLILSYGGFLTYIAFPAAPPWMASEMHLIPTIHKISSDVWWALGVHNFPTIYQYLSPNLTAAVPSLHSAYPLMIVLFVNRAFGWKWALALAWYPIAIWIGIVYMGEHYVFDAMVGVAYVFIAYWLTALIANRYGHHGRRLHTRIANKYGAKPLSG
ncbi:MAG TPA: phosphatase PAP2 family protein [Candidatus Saccharimonadales bacterium]|nr:phosphatase PAP2 family protein [Candidatus Saccharimonadales bacterium]